MSKEMTVKEAMKEVSGYINFSIYMGIRDDGSLRDKEFKKEENNKKKQIIALLKRGKAYEKIVKGLNGLPKTRSCPMSSDVICWKDVQKLEQKYLKEEK